MATALAKLSKARKLLAECQTLDDAKSIRDQAEAVRVYCKQQADSLDAQNYAAEIKLRAERLRSLNCIEKALPTDRCPGPAACYSSGCATSLTRAANSKSHQRKCIGTASNFAIWPR